jgi:DNA-binding SARP family transcriptional activator
VDRASRVRVWLLGGFRVEVNGRPVPDDGWRRNRARAVVKILALAPGHRLHREQVIDALWPDLGGDAGAANLRKAIHFARQAMTYGSLSTHGETVVLEGDVWVDVEAFDVAVEDGDLSGAVRLYSGELLPDDRFESWTEDRRDHLRARFVRCLGELAGRAEQAGDLLEAAQFLERVVALDPLHEDARRRLMTVHARAGDRHLALRQYKVLAAALRDELDVEPEPTTRQLVEDIASGRIPGRGPAAVGGRGAGAPEDPAGIAGPPVLSADARRAPLRDLPLVGRQRELETLIGFLRDVVDAGSPRLVIVSGPAGIGKSRLVREFSSTALAAVPAARVVRGRSLPAGRATTYGALGEILRETAGIALTASPDVAGRRLHRMVGAALEGGPAADIDVTTSALATSAGIAVPGRALDRLAPGEVANRIAAAWTRFATGLARLAPTILVAEDIHWASPELLDMLELVAARAEGPLLVLATARPELAQLRPGFGAAVDATTIGLRALTSTESGHFLGRLTEGRELAGPVRDRVLARAEGNPFYLEELTLHIRDGGLGGLPDTLQMLLSARLDALPPVDRKLLQEAAVIGRTFWLEPLHRAVPDERIEARLAMLERRGFVQRRPTSSVEGQEEFAFRHALIADVAYESVPRARRARAHARAGAWLEEVAAGRIGELGELLAHHYLSALGPTAAGPADSATRAKAFAFLLVAGNGARRRFAVGRAVELHATALDLADGIGERVDALEALGDDTESAYHGDDAAAYYGQALELARLNPVGAADRARIARRLATAMVMAPGAFHVSPDPAEVEALLAEGLAIVSEEPERGRLLLARGMAARLYRGSEPFGQGSMSDARPLADRVADVEAAAAIGRALGDDDLVTEASHARGMLYGLEGRFGEMLDLAEHEVRVLPVDASRLDRSDALRKLAVQLIYIGGDLERGLALGRESRDLIGDANPHQRMHTLWPMLTALFHLGRWAELPPLIEDDIAAFREEPAIECQFVRDGPVIAATTLWLQGRHDEALAVAALPGDPLTDLTSASAWQSRFALIRGAPETARAISHDKALEQRTYGPQHAFVLLEALAALGDWPAVEAFLPAAREAVAGNVFLGPLADRVEGELFAWRGDEAAAAARLRRAADAFALLGLPLEEARAAERLAAVTRSDAATERASALYRRLGIS